MGLFDQVAAAQRAWKRRRGIGSLRELRRIRQTLEVAVDSYRLVNGLAPYYGEPALVEAPESVQDRAKQVLRPGDFQTIWALEELARQFGVLVDHGTDLAKLGLERGWLGPGGELLMIPDSAIGMEWNPR